jgi:hypothetical protein
MALKFSLLMGFGFLEGLSLEPAMKLVFEFDPTIIPSALMITIGIFVALTFFVLSSPTPEYLFLGGFLYSSLSALLVLGFLNIFLKSQMLFDFYILLGLIVFIGYVVFDTQLIIEKAKNGEMDMVWDALGLFLDFISLFIKFVELLIRINKKEN